MAKETSPSRKIAIKTFTKAFDSLKNAGGSLTRKEIINKIRSEVQFTEWENERYENSETPRWEKIFSFYTIPLVKAGFLQKSKGTWSVTPQGEASFKKGVAEMISSAVALYRVWNKSKEKIIPSISDNGVEEELIDQKEINELTIEEYEEKATEGIRNYLKEKSPYEFQDFVAALLNAMGYHISYIAPPGPDSGIDIIAYNDPLGTQPPRIIVQVKHKPENNISSDEIQKLVGTMRRDTDVGIFVTSGLFSSKAKIEARQSGKHVEMIDFPRFIELWIKYYDKMNDEQKNLLPLQPIYFLGSHE